LKKEDAQREHTASGVSGNRHRKSSATVSRIACYHGASRPSTMPPTVVAYLPLTQAGHYNERPNDQACVPP
jgi:hypothetical protein